jgi:kynurenine formamidase
MQAPAPAPPKISGSKYSGTQTICSVFRPRSDDAATRWLHDRGSRMHGVERPSTDKPTDNIFAQYRLCRDLGISHWERLVNLEELLDKKEFQFFGVPLKFQGGSGSPVRAFAY